MSRSSIEATRVGRRARAAAPAGRRRRGNGPVGVSTRRAADVGLRGERRASARARAAARAPRPRCPAGAGRRGSTVMRPPARARGRRSAGGATGAASSGSIRASSSLRRAGGQRAEQVGRVVGVHGVEHVARALVPRASRAGARRPLLELLQGVGGALVVERREQRAASVVAGDVEQRLGDVGRARAREQRGAAGRRLGDGRGRARRSQRQLGGAPAAERAAGPRRRRPATISQPAPRRAMATSLMRTVLLGLAVDGACGRAARRARAARPGFCWKRRRLRRGAGQPDPGRADLGDAARPRRRSAGAGPRRRGRSGGAARPAAW